MTFVPLNNYVLVEVSEKKNPAALAMPDQDSDRINRGLIINPGRFGDIATLPTEYAAYMEGALLKPGDTVYWVQFSGSGRTTTTHDGRQIAQIPYDRLTMKEVK